MDGHVFDQEWTGMDRNDGVNPSAETRRKRQATVRCKFIVVQSGRPQHGDMLDRGLFLTRMAMGRQLAAMPHEIYLVRMIHQATHQAFPGERMWTAGELTNLATVRFLRVRNREGCDIYLHPFVEGRNAGYILLDLDHANDAVVKSLRAHGHEPCVVLQSSPGHYQAWLRLSRSPLEPALATAVAQQLARTHGGDLASAHWRHLGRLAGFTNQKPQRRSHTGYAPWVKIVYAQAGLVSRAEQLLHSVHPGIAQPSPPALQDDSAHPGIAPAQATQIYQYWIRRWRIVERFPQPDWSIVDLWIARQLLSQATPAAQVRAILQWGSPQFPRRHGHPQDYLRRTLFRAAFPASAPPVCQPAGPDSTGPSGQEG